MMDDASLPWRIFHALSAQHSEGFFLEGWGPGGEYLFAFDPVQSREGLCKIGEDHFQAAWSDLHSELIAGGQGLLFPLIGYGCGLELDRVRQMDRSGADFDFRLGIYADVYTWSSQLGLRLNGQTVDLPNLVALGSWQVSDFGAQVSESEYSEWVERTKDYILAGDIFQANLAHPLRMKIDGDPFALYAEIRGYNPSPYAGFWFDRKNDRYLLSNSPELLFELQGDRIVTKPIAGTRKRGRDEAHDQKLVNELFGNGKEQAEHLMLVDLERNDLGRVCEIGSVVVDEFMGCEQYRNVTHIVSTVSGRKKKTAHHWDLIRALFPGGTITGAPKLRSMEIIHELESHPRGLYTGSMGWLLPAGDMALNILIRSMQLSAGVGCIHVGAGLVADSIPAMEYRETLHKGSAWKKVLVDDRL